MEIKKQNLKFKENNHNLETKNKLFENKVKCLEDQLVEVRLNSENNLK